MTFGPLVQRDVYRDVVSLGKDVYRDVVSLGKAEELVFLMFTFGLNVLEAVSTFKKKKELTSYRTPPSRSPRRSNQHRPIRLLPLLKYLHLEFHNKYRSKCNPVTSSFKYINADCWCLLP